MMQQFALAVTKSTVHNTDADAIDAKVAARFNFFHVAILLILSKFPRHFQTHHLLTRRILLLLLLLVRVIVFVDFWTARAAFGCWWWWWRLVVVIFPVRTQIQTVFV
jgi:hypothetical protein